MNATRKLMPLVLASLVCSPALSAQAKVELEASLGQYSPLGSFDPTNEHSVNLPRGPGGLAGVAFGGAIRGWLGSRIGIELGGMTTSSFVGGGATPGGSLHSGANARVSAGTAQLLYRIVSTENGTRLWLGAGGSVVQHRGDAYEPYGSPVDYGGAASIGSAFHVIGALSATLGVSTMVYRLDIRGSATTDPAIRERGTQIDALVHAGISYGWR